MTEITFYHAVPSRSATVRWMLEEVGTPYDVHLLRLDKGDQRRPEYLAVNPLGKVPAICHRDIAITEVAAICTYLADAFPNAGLTIPISDPRRGAYLKWLFFSPSCIEPAMMDRAYPRREAPREGTAGYRDIETTAGIVAQAVTPGPWLMGEQFTAADIVVGSTIRFGMKFKLIPERPELTDYVARLEARPALQRATAADEALAAS